MTDERPKFVRWIIPSSSICVVGCDVLDCLPYRHVVVADFEFEFGDRDGNLPRVVCLVAKELREWRPRIHHATAARWCTTPAVLMAT
jgi:hypothetical protein